MLTRYKYPAPAAGTVPFMAFAPGAPTRTLAYPSVALKSTDRERPNRRLDDASSLGFSVSSHVHAVPLF